MKKMSAVITVIPIVVFLLNNSQTNKTMRIQCKGEDLHRESEKRTLNDFNKIKLGYPPPPNQHPRGEINLIATCHAAKRCYVTP